MPMPMSRTKDSWMPEANYCSDNPIIDPRNRYYKHTNRLSTELKI